MERGKMKRFKVCDHESICEDDVHNPSGRSWVELECYGARGCDAVHLLFFDKLRLVGSLKLGYVLESIGAEKRDRLCANFIETGEISEW